MNFTVARNLISANLTFSKKNQLHKRALKNDKNFRRNCHLLCFKLILASPVERDMTAPRENKEENGVVLEGGETGSNDNALKMASRNQAVM